MSVIVVGAEKGGVGKTSISLSLAHQAAQAGVDVVVLDTDRQKSASHWAEVRSQTKNVVPLSVLAHSADPLREIASLAKRYDLVVVDIGAQNYKVLLECALLADVYLVPSSTSGLDLDSTEEFYQLLQKVRGTKAPGVLRVLLNKAPPRPGSSEVARTRQRLAEAGVETLESVLSQRSAWRSLANTGLALEELPKRHSDERAQQEVREVYHEVVALMGRKRR